jgi:tRNA A37 N6-isopentenylltransferase MiaA
MWNKIFVATVTEKEEFSPNESVEHYLIDHLLTSEYNRYNALRYNTSLLVKSNRDSRQDFAAHPSRHCDVFHW